MEKVAYFWSLMDRHTSRLKVFFFYLRYHPLQTFMSGRRVSQVNFFYWGNMDDFSVFKFFFQPFLLFSIIPFKLIYFLDKN